MQRARRVVPLAVLALVAGVVLAGCRSNPDVAAYVQDTRITTASLDSQVEKVKADAKQASGNELADENVVALRRELLGDLVFIEVAKQYAAEKGYGEPKVDYAASAQAVGLAEDDPYVQATAQADAWNTLISGKTPPVTPTDADLRQVFDRALAAGLVQEGSYDQIKPQLEQIEQLGQGVAVRNVLADAAKRYNTTVNPRYAPAEYTVTRLSTNSGQSLNAIVVPFGLPASPAVTVAHS
jgi:hypothetical protein